MKRERETGSELYLLCGRGEERMREKVHKVKKVSSKRTKKEKKGGRHSSVVSSVPSILRPWVRTPSTICIIKIVIGIKKGRK